MNDYSPATEISAIKLAILTIRDNARPNGATQRELLCDQLACVLRRLEEHEQKRLAKEAKR